MSCAGNTKRAPSRSARARRISSLARCRAMTDSDRQGSAVRGCRGRGHAFRRRLQRLVMAGVLQAIPPLSALAPRPPPGLVSRERLRAVREPPNNQIKSCLAVQRCPDQQSDRNLGYRSRIYVRVFSDVCFRASRCCCGQWSLPSMQLRASRNEWIANM